MTRYAVVAALLAFAMLAFAAPVSAQTDLWDATVVVKNHSLFGMAGVSRIGYGGDYPDSTASSNTFTHASTTYTVNTISAAPQNPTPAVFLNFSPHPSVSAASNWTLHFGDRSIPFSRLDRAGTNWSWEDRNLWSPANTLFTDGASLSMKISTNAAPTVATAIPNQEAIAGTAFAYAFPDTTFNDADGDTLTYMARESDNSALPAWLRFTAATRSFSGMPAAAGTVAVKVTASDSSGSTVSDTFDIVVSPAPDIIAPTVMSIVRHNPVSSPTNADTLVWRVTFSEPVSNVDTADFTVSGTTATVTTVSPVPGAPNAHEITASGGDLANFNGPVTLSFAAGQNIADTAGNDLASTAPTGADEASYALDNTAPIVTISFPPHDPVRRDFSLNINFSEVVTGFDGNDITVGNGAVTSLGDGSIPNRYFVVDIMPTASGAVTVDVLADAAQDIVGNGNTAATQRSINYLPNVPATGSPAITGTARVGQTLTATPGTIADPDGFQETPLFPDPFVSNSSTTVQWIQVDGGVDRDISGATNGAYTLATADEGKQIKVRVDFEDAAFFRESRISAAYPAGGTVGSDNNPPLLALANEISDQPATVATEFSYTFPPNAFSDPDGDPLTYMATKSDGAALPAWLTFTAATRTFSGTPVTAGTVAVKVTASDDRGGSVSDTFDIVVSATDTTAPRVNSIVRRNPASSPTNANTLIWRVMFSEPMSNVDTADFTVSGATATAMTVSAVSGVAFAYDITVSGGDLATVTATVTLSFAGSQNIADTASNNLADTAPTGANEASYALDNMAPTLTITGVPDTSGTNPFTATFEFSEPVTGFEFEDIVLGNAFGESKVFSRVSSTVYRLDIEPDNIDDTVTVAVAANAARDLAGNGNTAAQVSGGSTGSVPIIFVEVVRLRVPEGSAASFKLVRSGGPSNIIIPELTVNVSVSETGGDRVAAGAEGARTVTIPASMASIEEVTLNIATSADSVDEADSVVTVTLMADTQSPATYFHHLGMFGAAAVTVLDDTRGVTVSGPTLAVTEGGTGSYTVVLDSQPTDSVTVTPSSDNGKVTVTSTLTFTATNWETAQTVTVTAAQDTDALDDSATIRHVVAGGDYAPVTAADVTVTVNDDETTDTVAPRVDSIVRHDPASSPTNADTLIWRVTFSEPVTGVDTADFTMLRTTAAATLVSPVTGMVEVAYDVTASGGDLANLNDTVTLSFVSGHGIADAASNDLSNVTPTGTNHTSYVLDNTAPTVTITGVPGASGPEPFTATFTFLEAVTGFDHADIVLGNATSDANDFSRVSPMVYTLLIAPDNIDGTLTVDVAADAAQDLAGNGNTVAARASATLSRSVPFVGAFVVGRQNITEGTAAVIELVRSMGPPTRAALTVNVSVSETTGDRIAAGEEGVRTVTIPAGAEKTTLSIATMADRVVEANSEVTITVTADTQSPTTYTPHPDSSMVFMFVLDDDTRGVTVSGPTLAVDEGGTGSYTVVLDSEPTDSVTVTPSSDNGEVTVSSALTFTTTNWNTAQTVTVTAAQDDDAVNDSATVSHAVAGGEAEYALVTAASVTVTVNDDENTTNSGGGGGGGGARANEAPEFPSDTVTRGIPENTAAGADIGAPIAAATDADGDALSYRLEGADAASFAFDAATRQLMTLAALDHETTDSYSVTVTADDGRDGTDTVEVTIDVADVDEPPAAPAAPSVAATDDSSTSLDLSWTEPGNDGRPAITGYDLQYRAGDSGDWTDGPRDVTATSSVIANLLPATSYQVRVRANNAEGKGDWSTAGSGSTIAPANTAPEFPSGTVTRGIPENTAAGADIGAPIAAATDADGDALRYSLEGADAASFAFDAATRQLMTLAALDHETTDSYSVTVTADDGRDGTDTVEVTIDVADVDEPPVAPAVRMAAVAEVTSLTVSWAAPANAGPPITDYDYRYRVKNPPGPWTEVTDTRITELSATITELMENTEYEVQIRANNDEGEGVWSVTVSASTIAPANTAPEFPSGTVTRGVPENTAAGADIGAPIAAATDADGDALRYRLEGADAASFAFDAATRQLMTLAALDHETTDSYSVTVTADDGRGGTDTVEVTINVTDLDEQGPAQGWLTRFGRTASDNAVRAIENRWRGERIANEASHLTLAGRQLNRLFNWGGKERTAGAVSGEALLLQPDDERFQAMGRQGFTVSERSGTTGTAAAGTAGAAPDSRMGLAGGALARRGGGGPGQPHGPCRRAPRAVAWALPAAPCPARRARPRAAAWALPAAPFPAPREAPG